MSGSVEKDQEAIKNHREEVERIKNQYGFGEPDRGNLDDPEIAWRNLEGKPDYTLANCTFFKEKLKNHAEGSLERIVENLVKTWEFEASHKLDINQWTSIDKENYTIKVNQDPIMDGEYAMKMGNYNILMKGCPAYQKYGVDDNFEKSHDLFRNAFTKGFPWEVLSVVSKPPDPVVFSWRHWAHFTGTFQGRVGTGQLIQMTGLCRVTVTEDLKIQNLEVYLDNDKFLEELEGNVDCLKSVESSQQSIINMYHKIHNSPTIDQQIFLTNNLTAIQKLDEEKDTS